MKSSRDSQLLCSELWGGEFWEDHYFERILGDKVTMQMIKKYIDYQKVKEKKVHQQMKLLE